MMGMVAREEVMVMKSSMRPIIEPFNRADMQQQREDDSFPIPQWQSEQGREHNFEETGQHCCKNHGILPNRQGKAKELNV